MTTLCYDIEQWQIGDDINHVGTFPPVVSISDQCEALAPNPRYDAFCTIPNAHTKVKTGCADLLQTIENDNNNTFKDMERNGTTNIPLRFQSIPYLDYPDDEWVPVPDTHALQEVQVAIPEMVASNDLASLWGIALESRSTTTVQAEPLHEKVGNLWMTVNSSPLTTGYEAIASNEDSTTIAYYVNNGVQKGLYVSRSGSDFELVTTKRVFDERGILLRRNGSAQNVIAYLTAGNQLEIFMAVNDASPFTLQFTHNAPEGYKFWSVCGGNGGSKEFWTLSIKTSAYYLQMFDFDSPSTLGVKEFQKTITNGIGHHMVCSGFSASTKFIFFVTGRPHHSGLSAPQATVTPAAAIYTRGESGPIRPSGIPTTDIRMVSAAVTLSANRLYYFTTPQTTSSGYLEGKLWTSTDGGVTFALTHTFGTNSAVDLRLSTTSNLLIDVSTGLELILTSANETVVEGQLNGYYHSTTGGSSWNIVDNVQGAVYIADDIGYAPFDVHPQPFWSRITYRFDRVVGPTVVELTSPHWRYHYEIHLDLGSGDWIVDVWKSNEVKLLTENYGIITDRGELLATVSETDDTVRFSSGITDQFSRQREPIVLNFDPDTPVQVNLAPLSGQYFLMYDGDTGVMTMYQNSYNSDQFLGYCQQSESRFVSCLDGMSTWCQSTKTDTSSALAFPEERCTCIGANQDQFEELFKPGTMSTEQVALLFVQYPCLLTSCSATRAFPEQTITYVHSRELCSNDIIVCSQSVSVEGSTDINVSFQQDCSSGTNSSCESSSDCASGASCYNNRCRQNCTSEAQCAPGLECRSPGVCVSPDEPFPGGGSSLPTWAIVVIVIGALGVILIAILVPLHLQGKLGGKTQPAPAPALAPAPAPVLAPQ